MATILSYTAASMYFAAYEIKHQRIPHFFNLAFPVIAGIAYYQGRDLLTMLKMAGAGWLLGIFLNLAGYMGPGDAKTFALSLMVAGSWAFVINTLIILMVILLVLFIRQHGITQMLWSGYFNLLCDLDTTTVKVRLPNSILFLAGVIMTWIGKGVIL